MSWSRGMTYVVFAVLLASACGGNKQDADARFVGSFRGDGVSLDLRHERTAGYQGTVEIQGQRYEVTAAPGGDGLQGSFTVGEQRFPIEVVPSGEGVTLTSEGTSYALRRTGAASANPLAGGAPAAAGGSEGGAAPPAAAGGAPPAPASAAPASFDGAFAGSIQGTPATMSLSRSGEAVTGSIDAQGYPYQIAGTASGSSLRGKLTDHQTGGVVDIEASQTGDALELTLVVPGQGGTQRVAFQFHRQGAGAAAPAPNGGRAAAGGGSGADQRNPALVGVWSRHETINSGADFISTKQIVQLNGDGTFVAGTGGTTGGGGGWHYEGGGGKVQYRGKWRTQANVLEVDTGQGWQPLARYYVEGNDLLITNPNGSKEVWKRN